MQWVFSNLSGKPLLQYLNISESNGIIYAMYDSILLYVWYVLGVSVRIMLQNKSEWSAGRNNCCTISSLTSGGVLPRIYRIWGFSKTQFEIHKKVLAKKC